MTKKLILCGAAALALGVASQSAEARKVTYEVNGTQYSYDSSDPQQVASARKRLDAANAAWAARAKADAERAEKPLSGIFGSQAQSEATQAQEHLEKVIAEEEEVDAARKEEWSSLTAKNWRRKKAGKQATQQEAAADTKPVATAEPQVASAGSPDSPENKSKAMVKSVSFDITSGIKTTIMVDGAVQEEPFDSTMLTKLAFEQGSANSLTAFVKQLREASPQPAPAAPAPAPTPGNPASPQN